MGMKSVFAPLTIDESEILRDHLWSGRRKQAHVHGYVEGGRCPLPVPSTKVP
jgi:hypothetical protein